MELTAAEQEQIIRRLHELGATLPCPRCAASSFSLFKELRMMRVNPIDPDSSTTSDDELVLPAALLICDQCGFLSPHALTALGLAREIFSNIEGSGGDLT